MLLARPHYVTRKLVYDVLCTLEESQAPYSFMTVNSESYVNDILDLFFEELTKEETSYTYS
jgi:hypothetical protein